ncbi:toxin_Txe_YoeB, addiction module toxin, Txe/YoeB family [Flavobacteriaceae bacterium]|jgi:toxin YoeB
MEVIFLPLAKEHRDFWIKTGNKPIQKKISALIGDILKHPYEGIGKPHALKHKLSGSWARSINDEHRLVYEIT